MAQFLIQVFVLACNALRYTLIGAATLAFVLILIMGLYTLVQGALVHLIRHRQAPRR